ncbi:MAG: TonB-dependent receptor [Campylobacterota bacterium]|nr:TonB-dependent receptor [Campylobacterota bacterium]
MKKTNLSITTALLLATNLYSSQDLGTINISSATKSEQSIKDTTSNVEVITSYELEEKHIATVSEALNSLSGISITSNGGLGQLDSLFIRGVDSKRVLILIDGIRYNEPAGLSGAPLAQLMVSDIEKIEIVKGAQSGIWGADASGGVINIISKKPKEGLSGDVLLEGGSFNTKKITTTLGAKKDNYFIKLNANKISTDGFSAFEAKEGTADYGKRGDELGFEKDGYENTTYSVQGGVNITSNDTLKMLYKNIDAQYDYDSSTADDSTKVSYINHYFKNIDYTHKKDDYSVNLKASQSKFNRTQDTFNAQSLVNEFAIQSKISYRKEDTLLVGLSKQNFEDIVNNRKYQTDALFVSNLNKFDKFIFSQALRYDNNNMFDEKVTGKLGLKYNFNQELYISSNYGTAYNAPTLGNLSYTSTLKPESTISYDVSVGYSGLKVTYFENKIEDMINYTFVPSFHYINEDGTSTLKGFEIDYKKDIMQDILLSINYTNLNAKDKDGKDLARRAKEDFKFGIDYYGVDKLHIGLNGQYVGERYDKANKQGAQTGKYTIANFVANYDIKKDLKVYTKVDNITDKYYQTVDGYATTPRAYYAGIKYSF